LPRRQHFPIPADVPSSTPVLSAFAPLAIHGAAKLRAFHFESRRLPLVKLRFG
jgi:hypothetical protein